MNYKKKSKLYENTYGVLVKNVLRIPNVCIISGLFILFSVSSSYAAHYDVDASHSHVGFKIRHLVSKLPGEFKEFDGSFEFDEKKPTDAKVTFKVKTASIFTNHDKRDEHLRGEDFFDVSKYPEMKFESTSVSKVGKDKYLLKGNLTLRGVTKPVSFNVIYSGSAKDPWGNQRAGFTATTKINRKDFGMVWNKALDQGGVMIGDDVEINLEIEAIEKASNQKS